MWVTCFLRELGKQLTNTGKKTLRGNKNLHNYSNRMYDFNFSSHYLNGVCENVEVVIISKNDWDVYIASLFYYLIWNNTYKKDEVGSKSLVRP